MCGRDDQEQRIAIGRRSDDRLSSDIAAGTRPVIDNELLSEPLRQSLSQHAGKEIGVAKRVVSPDRKTMTITYKGVNTRGDLVDNVGVYDRQ